MSIARNISIKDFDIAHPSTDKCGDDINLSFSASWVKFTPGQSSHTKVCKIHFLTPDSIITTLVFSLMVHLKAHNKAHFPQFFTLYTIHASIRGPPFANALQYIVVQFSVLPFTNANTNDTDRFARQIHCWQHQDALWWSHWCRQAYENTNARIHIHKQRHVVESRVAEVGGPQDRRSTKGQGLLRKEGPPTYAILSQNSALSRFTRFLKGFCKALNESHPAFIEYSAQVILLS